MKKRFAIEVSLNPRHGHFILGDLWLWSDNVRIGDNISGVDLPLVLAHLSGPLYLGKRRYDEQFDKLSKEEAADFFIRLRYAGEEGISDSLLSVGYYFYRYLVVSAYNLEGFDSVLVALLGRANGGDRLLWKPKYTDSVCEQLLDRGEYDACVLSCFDWLEAQTGYRSAQRAWLDLQESQRERLRGAILAQCPHLGEPDQRELLDQAAIDELVKGNGDREKANGDRGK